MALNESPHIAFNAKFIASPRNLCQKVLPNRGGTWGVLVATAVPRPAATVLPNWWNPGAAPGVSPLAVALGGFSWLLEAPCGCWYSPLVAHVGSLMPL